MSRNERLLQGVYPADRAAALAGVPRSTLYYWARHDIWTPSRRISSRPKLWTYSDLIAARIIYWLRKDKPDIGSDRTSMHEVRKTLSAIRDRGKEIWESDLRVFVDRDGHAFFETQGTVRRGTRPWTSVIPGALDVLAEFPSREGRLGPDLVTPRPHLSIIAGKLSGAPHVTHTRVATLSLAALRRDGLDLPQVLSLYPDLTDTAIRESWDLEDQLEANVVRAA